MRDALSEAIRSIILPRLVAAGRARDLGLAHEGKSITEHDISTMLAHVLTPDHSVAEAMLTLLKLRGASRLDVLAGLLLAVEERLLAMRREGRCSQSEATLGHGRLQRLMRSKALPPHKPIASDARTASILIARLPDESASVAAAVIDDMFRGAGWETHLWTVHNASDIPKAVGSLRFDVIMIAPPRERAPALSQDFHRVVRSMSSAPLVEIHAGRGDAADGARAAEFGRAVVVRDIRKAVRAAEALLPISS